MFETRLRLAGCTDERITLDSVAPSAPDILRRRALASFFSIPFTHARHVDDLTPTEVAEAAVVLEVEREIAGGAAPAAQDTPEPEPDELPDNVIMLPEPQMGDT